MRNAERRMRTRARPALFDSAFIILHSAFFPPLCFAALVLTVVSGRLGAQAPSVNRSVPGAVVPGKSTEVALYGSGLDAPTALWTSVPATATFTAGSGDHATCRITLPPEAQVGVAALRVGTRGGVSNPHLFRVDDLPSV